MNRLFGIAAIIAAALIGDGVRRLGRSFEIRAETDRDAFEASMDLVDESETVH